MNYQSHLSTSRLTAILSSFASYKRLTAQADDDWADRLSHLYTVVLLVVFAVFISGGGFIVCVIVVCVRVYVCELNTICGADLLANLLNLFFEKYAT